MGNHRPYRDRRICIHPDNPDLVYVAALGDAFGPNEERGVFRSSDALVETEGDKTGLYRSDDAPRGRVGHGTANSSAPA